ncbi:MAG: phosphoglycolate phosphatase [Crenarchaeota archaeon]|nr:phosphoglycolate phosphatase [Thermoproteota archaeon]
MFKINIRSIILDIDGTLTEDRNTERLSLEAIAAIREALDTRTDLEIGLATGNSHIVAISLARYIGLDFSRCPVISENGCLLWYKGKLYDICADYEEDIEKSREIIRKEALGKVVRESYQNEYRRRDFAYYPLPNICPETAVEFIRSLLDKYGLHSLDVRYSGYAIHVIPKTVNKGTAVRLYSEISGISIENMVAIGDSDTDIELLSSVGLPVAVSNATEGLKKVAKIVLSKPSGAGVAEFFRKFILYS